MKVKTTRKIGYFIGVIAVIAVIIGVSWLGTCGIIKLITLYFGWPFKWSVATGIWLIMWLFGGIFRSSSK